MKFPLNYRLFPWLCCSFHLSDSLGIKACIHIQISVYSFKIGSTSTLTNSIKITFIINTLNLKIITFSFNIFSFEYFYYLLNHISFLFHFVKIYTKIHLYLFFKFWEPSFYILKSSYMPIFKKNSSNFRKIFTFYTFYI